ncbi:MAG TPA: FmdB family zinc ribbon protein [Fimbriimonadaceae bacterium]|jgi:putative FmdB family regulatory protein
MPTYVYECSACKKVFEADQRITEDALKDCDCGGEGTLKRLIQPIAVMFKGSGFHINDYAAKSAPAETPSPEAPKATETPAPAAAETTPVPTPAPAATPAPASESKSE